MGETGHLIIEKQQVWLQTPFQAAMPAAVTAIEGDLFWTTLPREGGQVLILQPGEKVMVGVSVSDGFYTAETEVRAVAEDDERFYGLAMPQEFQQTQHRQFARLPVAKNVVFSAGSLTAQTTLINISSGGMMVYLVPALNAIIQSGQPIHVRFKLNNTPFYLPVRQAWRKTYDHIPFAGFQFQKSPPALRLKMAQLCILRQAPVAK